MNENNAIESTPRTLNFTCPHCGGHTLRQYDANPYYWSCTVSVWLEDEDDPETAQIDEESEPTYERQGDPMDDPGWCCADCGRVLCYANGSSLGTEDSLAEWLLEHCPQENPSNEIDFTCPVCGSQRLDQVGEALARSEPGPNECRSLQDQEKESKPEVAVSPDLIPQGGESFRYRCINGHELANDDGTPVENQKELFEWLKAHGS